MEVHPSVVSRYLADEAMDVHAGFSLGPGAGPAAQWPPLVGTLPPPRDGSIMAHLAGKRMQDPHGGGTLYPRDVVVAPAVPGNPSRHEGYRFPRQVPPLSPSPS